MESRQSVHHCSERAEGEGSNWAEGRETWGGRGEKGEMRGGWEEVNEGGYGLDRKRKTLNQ